MKNEQKPGTGHGPGFPAESGTAWPQRGRAGTKSHRRGTWGHLQYSDCLPATHGAHLRRPTRRLQAQAEPCGPGKNQTERVGRVPAPFQWELPQAEHFCFSFEGSKELGTVHGGMRAKRR